MTDNVIKRRAAVINSLTDVLQPFGVMNQPRERQIYPQPIPTEQHPTVYDFTTVEIYKYRGKDTRKWTFPSFDLENTTFMYTINKEDKMENNTNRIVTFKEGHNQMEKPCHLCKSRQHCGQKTWKCNAFMIAQNKGRQISTKLLITVYIH